MKLKYDKPKAFRVIYPVDLKVMQGTVYETTDKDLQKRLIDLGFQKVVLKEDKNKEGDK